MMNAVRRLDRLEERIRALGAICLACHNLGPDLAQELYRADLEGREPVRACPDCGRPARLRVEWRLLAREMMLQEAEETTPEGPGVEP